MSGSVYVLISSRLFTFAFSACASGVISKKNHHQDRCQGGFSARKILRDAGGVEGDVRFPH